MGPQVPSSFDIISFEPFILGELMTFTHLVSIANFRYYTLQENDVQVIRLYIYIYTYLVACPS